MRRLKRAFALVTVMVAVLTLGAVPAWGAETANSEVLIIREDDTVRDDLYAGAIRVVVQGRVEGDLIVFAAEEVVIDGTVTGSVTAITPRISVDGIVEGSLRAAAGSVAVGGDIGGDVVVSAVDVVLGPESVVAGGVIAWAWEMGATGAMGSLRGTQRALELGGTVRADVDVSVGSLAVVEPLRVAGDLGFRSENEARGLDRATVEGVVVHKTPLPPNVRVRALFLFTRFLLVLFLTITALTACWGWPGHADRAIRRVGRAPIRLWARGAIVVFSPFILAAIAALIFAVAPAAASFPLLGVFVPLILAALGLVAAVGLVAGVPVVGRLGRAILPRTSVYGAVLAGSTITGLIWLLPFLGWVVPLVVLPLGLGAWLGTPGDDGRSGEPERAEPAH